MSFIDKIKERAKSEKMSIVLPETEDRRVIIAASKVIEEGLANIILIGDPEKIQELAKQEGVSVEGAKIVNPVAYPGLDDYIVKFYQIRKRKGMTLNEARRVLISNKLFFGVMMVKMKEADGMTAGACNKTASVLRPALQILKTRPDAKLVSSFTIEDVPNCEYGNNGVFVFSDCGLVQNPNSEELCYIAGNAAQAYHDMIGEGEPIVALLSHSTMGSASHPDVDKVAKAAEMAMEEYPFLKIDGEFQLDAAIVPEVGASKAPDNEVAGRANVLVFPDLDSGNIAYKLVERLAKAEAYGPITQGIAAPVNDLSRGCNANDIVGVVSITAVQAQMMKQVDSE